MRRLLIISVILFPACAFADYDPFSSKPPTEASVTVVSPEATQAALTPVAAAPAVDPSTLLDAELRRLMGELKARDQETVEPSDEVEYIATTNCVDIYYHTAEKRYEERPTKACLADKAKKVVESGIKKNHPANPTSTNTSVELNQASLKKESSK